VTWLWILLGAYLLASSLLVRVLAKAADLKLGFAGSALLIIFGPVIALVIVALFFLGIVGNRKRRKREEEMEEDEA